MSRIGVCWILALAVVIGAVTPASGAGYGPWRKAKTSSGERYAVCVYKYEKPGGGTGTNYVYWYWDDPAFRGYYVFAQSHGATPWARCMCPAHPDHNFKVMKWEYRKPGGGYEPYTDAGFDVGYCPKPGQKPGQTGEGKPITEEPMIDSNVDPKKYAQIEAWGKSLPDAPTP